MERISKGRRHQCCGELYTTSCRVFGYLGFLRYGSFPLRFLFDFVWLGMLSFDFENAEIMMQFSCCYSRMMKQLETYDGVGLKQGFGAC
jgi:hypothetical protein